MCTYIFVCSHAFLGVHAWLPEAICKSVCMWVSLLVCKEICLICVCLIGNLDYVCCCGGKPVGRRGIVLEGSNWPFSWTSGLCWALIELWVWKAGKLISIVWEKMEDYTDSRRKCLFFLEHVGWTQRTNAGSGFRRPLLLRKTWGLTYACGLKTREGFEWFLCFPPALDSEPFKGTFFLIFAFPHWVCTTQTINSEWIIKAKG